MPDSPSGANGHVPQLGHKLLLSEEEGKIVLDISDGYGNRMKVFLDLAVASKLGQNMADKSRAAVAKAKDDPARHETRAYNSEADMSVSIGEAV